MSVKSGEESLDEVEDYFNTSDTSATDGSSSSSSSRESRNIFGSTSDLDSERERTVKRARKRKSKRRCEKRSKQDPSPKRQKYHHRPEKTNTDDKSTKTERDEEKRSRKSRECSAGPNTLSETLIESDLQQQTPAAEKEKQQTFTVKHLIAFLPVEVRDTDLAKETVQMILNTHTEEKKIMDAIRGITRSETWYPIINERSYLFSNAATNAVIGLSDPNVMLLSQGKHLLHLALTKPINTAKNSLDYVFRNALREIAFEFNTIGDQNVDNTLEKPMFISSRYLELTLLKKIRAHYMRTLDEDIVSFFTRASPDAPSELATLVGGSACENYVRLLYIRLCVRSVGDFDKLMDEKPLGVKQMIVWTNKRAQVQMDLCIRNYLNSVYEAARDKWYNLSEEEKKSRETLMKFFTEEYAEHMTAFLRTHRPFLEEVFRFSELMAWFCFGVTLDDVTGFHSMATSYFILKSDCKRNIPFWRPVVCCNYALAASFSKRDQGI